MVLFSPDDDRPWMVRVCRWLPSEGRPAGESLWREMFDARYASLGTVAGWNPWPTFRLTLDFGPPKEDVHRDLFEVEVGVDASAPGERSAEGLSIAGFETLQAPLDGVEHGRIRWFLSQLGISDDEFDEDGWSRPTKKRLISAIGRAIPEPGLLELSDDEIQVFRLLGEQIPYLWDHDRFAAWALANAEGR